MKTALTPAQLRRAQYDRLVASLRVPQHTSIKTAQPSKQKPATGKFASA